jgi:hypothetical protein
MAVVACCLPHCLKLVLSVRPGLVGVLRIGGRRERRRAAGQTGGPLWKRYGNFRPQEGEAEASVERAQARKLRAFSDSR